MFLPVGAVFLFIGMYLLSETADAYLSPALETITVRFKLPESFAGVTLLALGNGAPDVFSSIAAAQGKDPNAITSVSIVVGGTFFISSVVVALSTRASNLNPNPNEPPIHKIKVTPRFFLRDLTFYMITIIYLIVIMLAVKEFTVGTSAAFLIIYTIYVILVVV